VGHTSADYETARDAFAAGASILTHTFNAMPPLHHREPGPIGAAFAVPHVTLELINDGLHVHPELARLLFTQAPGRVALITDAMAAACSHDGDYVLGSLAVTVRDGVARLRAAGTIAGSTLTLDAALRQSVAACGVELADAVLALTATPAAAIGRSGDLGSLRPGFAADAVLLDRDLTVRRVWLAGRSSG
jgi:N-acetylglucosamine-6-phosphate deacetylase